MTKQRYEVWLVRSIAGIVFINGLLAIYRPLAERIPDKLESLLMPIGYDYGGRSLDIIIGVTLMYFSYQLLQRRLAAWWVAFVSTVLLLVIHLTLSRLSFVAIGPLVGLVMLLATKQYFRVRSEVSLLIQGITIFLASIAIALAYGTIGFYLMTRSDFGGTFSLQEAAYHSGRAFLLLGNPSLYPHTRHARWFLSSLGVFGISVLFYGLYSLFRPVAYQLRTLPAERERLQDLLSRYSKSSDDYFKLWPHDKSYFFSPGNRAGLAYGVSKGVALVVGDPVGAPADIPELLKLFEELCSINAWLPAYVYVSGHFLPDYRELSYEVLKVGEDALVNLGTFKTTTSRNKHFRNIANRFEREGTSVSFHEPPHSRTLLDELEVVSRDWAMREGRQEWRFVAGSFNRQYLQIGPLFVARDRSGQAMAFANQIPSYIAGLATIDLMRYRQDAPGGIMDFMFTSMMLQLDAMGYTKFNLGLAPFSGLDGEVSQPEEKFLNLIYRSNQKIISLRGLRQFKSKFEPVWEPKYVAYKGGTARLPSTAYALFAIMHVSKDTINE